MSNTATEGGQQGQAPAGQPAGNGTGQGQESGQQPQGQAPAGQQQQGQGSDAAPSLDSITDPTLRAYVEAQIKDASEARKEAAKYRTERNTFQTQVQEFQRQNETDEQRIERERAERDQEMERLRQENRELRVNTRAETAAKDAKAHNPARVAALIASNVELDKDGNPTNLADLIQALKQSDPYLFKRTDVDAGAGGGQDQTPTLNMNDAIRRAAGRQV